MKKFYVYLHCRPNGTPFYVGKGHGNRMDIFYGRNKHHKSVVKHYGSDSIVKVLYQYCDTESDAFSLEIGLIAFFRDIGLKLVNYSTGGEGNSGYVFTEEQRTKLSASQKGRKVSKSTRDKISKSNKEHSVSEETIRKIIAANTGRKWTQEALAKRSASIKGSKRTLEQREKISQGIKEHYSIPENRQMQSERCRGRIVTELHRKNMSTAAKGKIISFEHRKTLSQSAKKAWERKRQSEGVH